MQPIPIPEPARQTIGFGLPRVGSFNDVSARSGSFDSSVGGHFAAHPGISRMAPPSHSGSHDSDAGGRAAPTGAEAFHLGCGDIVRLTITVG